MSRGKRKSTRREKDTHHLYFPKKLYGKNNKLMEINFDFHHDFHNFFMGRCKSGGQRDCHKTFCRFGLICCYHKTYVDFGKRVV